MSTNRTAPIRWIFNRDPDLAPHVDFHELEIATDGWLQLALGTDTVSGPVWFGVLHIEAARTRMATIHGIVSGVLALVLGVVLLCDLDDPWGNKLGFYQDLDAETG